MEDTAPTESRKRTSEETPELPDAYMARIRRDEPLSFQEEPGPGRRTRETDARARAENWSSGTFG